MIRRLPLLLLLFFGAGPMLMAHAAAPGLELVVLGSGGPGAAGRAASSYLVSIDGVPRILVDAGPGSFARLGEAQISLDHTDTVLLTHLHIDHAAESWALPNVVAISGSWMAPRALIDAKDWQGIEALARDAAALKRN
jgi:glyoxylase-like metal-dependent hydrolase (beta-lactamase superfamily II)